MDNLNKVIKTNVARVLANENITVEYGNHETAAFDVKNRKLLLPNWSHKSNDVHDLLVGHEVGHALYTPVTEKEVFTDIDSERPVLVHQYMNVVEDARIERDIKSQYPGLKRSFFNGYKTLLEDDLFKLEGRDIADFNLIDRINLFFKIGNHVFIPFEDEEKPFLSRIEKADSFEDVMSIVKDLYKFSKDKAEKDLSEMGDSETADHDYQYSDIDDGNGSGDFDFDNESGDDGNNNSGIDGEESDQTGDESDDIDSDGNAESGEGFNNSSNPLDELLESETEKALSEAINEMVSKPDRFNDDHVPHYYYVPEVNAKDFTIPLHKVHQHISSYYENYINDTFDYKPYYTKFKRDNMKIVNYMAKEFELRKNAEQMSRASVSKTGVIDVNKLHSYKFNDDLFRRVTAIPGGKNHGMVMFLDWSGSMSDSITHVIRQSMILAMFCKKVGIPFHLYGFTDACMSYDGATEIERGRTIYGFPSVKYQEKDYKLQNFRLREYLNSSLNNKAFDKAMLNLFTLAENFNKGYFPNIPKNEELSSTPLNDAIVVAHDLIPKIKSYYKLEKVTSIWLTDGDSNNNDARHFDNDEERPLTPRTYTPRVLVNRLNKTHYLANTRREMTNALLESLSDSTGITNIGFFIVSRGSDMRNLKHTLSQSRKIDYFEIEKRIKALNRTKSAIFTEVQGYDEWYVIKGGSELDIKPDSLEIERGAKKGRITTALKRFTKNRTNDRVIMNSLVKVIS